MKIVQINHHRGFKKQHIQILAINDTIYLTTMADTKKRTRPENDDDNDDPKPKRTAREEQTEFATHATEIMVNIIRRVLKQGTGVTKAECMELFGGLGPSTPRPDLIKMYRVLSKVFHPDRSKRPNATAEFQLLAQVFSMLKSNDFVNDSDKSWVGSDDSDDDVEPEAGRYHTDSHEYEKAKDTVISVHMQLFEVMKQAEKVVEVIIRRYNLRNRNMRTVKNEFTIFSPAGVDTGDIICRLPEMGNWDEDAGKHGDLIFTADVCIDPQVTRKKADLYLDVELPLHQVLSKNAGFSVTVLRIVKTLRLKNNAWHGDVIIYPREGLPMTVAGVSGRGALHISLKVARPQFVSDRALQELAKTSVY